MGVENEFSGDMGVENEWNAKMSIRNECSGENVCGNECNGEITVTERMEWGGECFQVWLAALEDG